MMILRITPTTAQRTQLWKATDRRRQGLMRTNLNEVQRFLNLQKKVAAQASRKAVHVDDMKAHVNAAVDRTIPEGEATFNRLWVRTAVPFARETYNSIQKAKPRTDWHAAVQSYMRTHNADKVVGVTETTKKRIAAIIDSGVQANKTMQEIADDIDHGVQLQQIIKNRSFVIARTETIAGSNFGSQAGALATGLDLQKEWVATQDDRTRDDHLDADGQTVDINTTYSVGGEMLRFAGDPNGSAENIINCRCTEVYVEKNGATQPQPQPEPVPQPLPPEPVPVPKPLRVPKPKPAAEGEVTLEKLQQEYGIKDVDVAFAVSSSGRRFPKPAEVQRIYRRVDEGLKQVKAAGLDTSGVKIQVVSTNSYFKSQRNCPAYSQSWDNKIVMRTSLTKDEDIGWSGKKWREEVYVHEFTHIDHYRWDKAQFDMIINDIRKDPRTYRYAWDSVNRIYGQEMRSYVKMYLRDYAVKSPLEFVAEARVAMWSNRTNMGAGQTLPKKLVDFYKALGGKVPPEYESRVTP